MFFENLVIEDGKDNTLNAVSVIKSPHLPGPSLNLPEGSLNPPPFLLRREIDLIETEQILDL